MSQMLVTFNIIMSGRGLSPWPVVRFFPETVLLVKAIFCLSVSRIALNSFAWVLCCCLILKSAELDFWGKQFFSLSKFFFIPYIFYTVHILYIYKYTQSNHRMKIIEGISGDMSFSKVGAQMPFSGKICPMAMQRQGGGPSRQTLGNCLWRRHVAFPSEIS